MAIERCKPCVNPHDSSDTPKHLTAGLTQYVLNNFAKKSPPYHVTQDYVSAPLQQPDVERLTGHQSVRGRGGVTAVLLKAHWAGLSEPSWEREMDLQRYRTHICVIGPAFRTSTAKPTVFTAGCGLVRHSVSSPGTTGSVFCRRATLVFHARSGSGVTAIRYSPREPTFGSRVTMGCGSLEKSVRIRRRMEYTWSDFWTTRGRSSFLFPRRATRPQRKPYEVLGAFKST